MKNEPDPAPPNDNHPKTAEETGFFSKCGVPCPPTHPDHGPMHLLPRLHDGWFAAYYYKSKAELAKDKSAGHPTARRARHDGWTPERIEELLRHLRSTASITDACRAVGMTRKSAYDLYNRKDSAHIRKAWDEALRATTVVLATTAFDRAVNGVEERVFHKGECVGLQTKYDNRHLQWMLRVRDPLNFAPLDDLEGWLKHRAIEQHEPEEPSLDRLAEAEENWRRQLPGEGDAYRDERILPPEESQERLAGKQAPLLGSDDDEADDEQGDDGQRGGDA